MNTSRLLRLCCVASLLLAVEVIAETEFITDTIQVGLHQEKTLDSPIVTVLPSGTPVEVIKREENLSYVQGPAGDAGWIDNTYLNADDPDNNLQTDYRKLETELAQANQRLRELQGNVTAPGAADPAGDNAYDSLLQDHEALKKQFNSERLRAGELQVQLAELKKRIGQDNDNQSLYRQIQQLQEENKNLEIQLAGTLGQGQISLLSGTTGTADDLLSDWKHKLIYFSIALVIGLCLGIYLMDYLGRRRHGGFRI